MKFVLLYKIFILSIQDKYTNCTRGIQDHYFVKDFMWLWKSHLLISLSQGWNTFPHTLVNHTFISYALCNLYVVIWILTLLMMIVKQNCTTIFPLLLNQTNANIFNWHMRTFTRQCMKSKSLYKSITLIVQYKIINKVYKLVFVKDFKWFWKTLIIFFVFLHLRTAQFPHSNSLTKELFLFLFLKFYHQKFVIAYFVLIVLAMFYI